MSSTTGAAVGWETDYDQRTHGCGAGDAGIDAATFAALYEEHRTSLYRFCVRRSHDPAIAEDLVQDVFEKAFAHRSRYDPAREFWPWLASIAARVCIDAHRRSVSADARRQLYAWDTSAEPFDATAAAVVAKYDQRQLQQQIAALPARQRAAIVLFAVDGWSYQQIADHFGDSVTAVKALLRRARCTLRDSCDRWAGGVMGAFHAARWQVRRRSQRLLARTWPPLESWGASTAAMLANAPGAVMAIMVVSGLLLPTGAGSAVDPPESKVSMVAHGAPSPSAPGVAEPPAPDPDTGRTTPRVPGVERAGNDVIAAALPGSAGADDPESIAVQAFAPSPNYEEAPTIFAAGGLAGRVEGVSMPLLATHDGGATWERRPAVGLGPVANLALAPSYPRDRRLFATTLKGLQVSYDDGASFETLATLPQASSTMGGAVPQSTDLAISPSFDRDDPTILFTAGQRLWQYDDATGTVASVALGMPLSGHLASSVAYAGQAGDTGSIVLGSRLPEPVNGDPQHHVSRCTKRSMPDPVAAPHLDCVAVRLPVMPSPGLRLRVNPLSRDGVVYAVSPSRTVVSTDGGRTFTDARPPSTRLEDLYRIEDVAVFPSDPGSAIAAQYSYASSALALTDDGGTTWTPVKVGLPNFLTAEHVVVTPTGRIIAASSAGGIACSIDRGRTWSRTCPIPEG